MPTVDTSIDSVELKKIQHVFKELLTSMESKLKDDDKENIIRAFELALDAHRFQRRKSGEAYIFHPLEVARICHEEIGLGPTAIVGAILHDVVEDTPVTLEDIQELFDQKITLIVDGLTKLDGLYHGDNQNAKNLKKVLSTLVDDVRVVLIKMADRLHNLRTIKPMPRHKKLKIAAETMFIYAPLAHRLGLYQIKTEFEDICMRVTDNETYLNITQKIHETEEERSRYIKKFIKPLEDKIEEIGISFRILGRPKSIYSIWNKIKTKNVDFEEIYDLFAVRIIIDVPRKEEKSACWQVYSIITDHYKPIPERLKDWVTTPKGNGYESLHTTVIGPAGKFVEVQIRSERMDDIAERGFAAHWKYKGIKSEGSNVYDKWLDNIRTLLDTPDEDAIDFLNDFKTNLFKEEIYVFTPRGDMRILPKGATALDFAFDIHSDVGATATAIKVNNKLVPMGHQLQNGDQVTVTTTKSQSPSENWLKMVITGKARSKIRAALSERKKQLAELGKDTLQRKLKNWKIEFDSNLETLVSYFGYRNRQELYLAIYMEEIKIQDIQRDFDVINGILKTRDQSESQSIKTTKKVASRLSNKSAIIINDQMGEDISYNISTCCNPLPGDDIFAFLTSNSGLKIHRFNCSNASNLFTNYGYRILKAEWADKVGNEYDVELVITGVDSGPGIIQNIINEISTNLSLNIKSFTISGEGGFYEAKIKIVVKDKSHLSMVMNRIKEMKHVSTVIRHAGMNQVE